MSPLLSGRRAAILQSWMEPLAVAGGSRPWAAMMVGVLILRHELVARGLLAHDDPAIVEGQVRQHVGRALDALEQGFRQP